MDADATVLDAGCGTGRVTEMLLEKVPDGRVVALDAAPSMVTEARQRLAPYGDRVLFVRGRPARSEPRPSSGAGPRSTPCCPPPPSTGSSTTTGSSPTWPGYCGPGGRLVAQCGAEGNIARLIEAVRTTGLERTGAWYYASPEDTRRRLEASGFTDIEVWTHPEPTPIDPAELGTYLETVCLRTLVAPMAAGGEEGLPGPGGRGLGEPVIDYLRLNIVARRA